MPNGGTIGKIFRGAKNVVTGGDKDINAGIRGLKSMVKKVPKGKEQAMYQHILPYQLKGKYAWGAVAAVGAGSVLDSGLESRHIAQMGGRVTAGEGLSGMTNSVKLSDGIQRMQKGEEVGFSNSLRNAGADGDIVFALHNMR